MELGVDSSGCTIMVGHWSISVHLLRMTAHTSTWAVGVCTIDQSNSTVLQRLTAPPLNLILTTGMEPLPLTAMYLYLLCHLSPSLLCTSTFCVTSHPSLLCTSPFCVTSPPHCYVPLLSVSPLTPHCYVPLPSVSPLTLTAMYLSFLCHLSPSLLCTSPFCVTSHPHCYVPLPSVSPLTLTAMYLSLLCHLSPSLLCTSTFCVTSHPSLLCTSPFCVTSHPHCYVPLPSVSPLTLTAMYLSLLCHLSPFTAMYLYLLCHLSPSLLCTSPFCVTSHPHCYVPLPSVSPLTLTITPTLHPHRRPVPGVV